MDSTKISHQKILLRTLLKVLLIIIIVFFFNSWPQIKQSLNGNIPPLSYWLDHTLKLSNVILIIGFGVYFYYKDLTDQRSALFGTEK